MEDGAYVRWKIMHVVCGELSGCISWKEYWCAVKGMRVCGTNMCGVRLKVSRCVVEILMVSGCKAWTWCEWEEVAGYGGDSESARSGVSGSV